MTDFYKNVTLRWQDCVNVVLGLWLAVSAWILGFAEIATATWNAVIFGLVMAVAAFAALVQYRKWEDWLDGVIGLWLVITPFVFGFAAFSGGTAAVAATWNLIVVGLLATILAFHSALTHTEDGAHA